MLSRKASIFLLPLLNGFIIAESAERLIYHNRKGITACQENLSNGAFRSRRRFISGRRRIVNPCQLKIQKRQLNGTAIAITNGAVRGSDLVNPVTVYSVAPGRYGSLYRTVAVVRKSATDESDHCR
jgi:ribosomal protein L15E